MTPYPNTCPWCGRENDHVTAPPGSPRTTPEEGDISICFECHKLIVFTSAGSRKASDEEQDDLKQIPQIRDLLYALSQGMTPSQASKFQSN